MPEKEVFSQLNSFKSLLMNVSRLTGLVSSLLILTLSLTAQPVQEKQMSIVVKKTATWCSNCGSWGWQWFKDAIDDTEGDAFPIALHSTSSLLKPPMDLDGALIAQFSGNGGFPTFFVNGTAYASYASLVNAVGTAAAASPLAGIGLETGFSNDLIQVQGNVKFFQPFQGEIAVAYYLIRDSLVFTQAVQGPNAIHRYVVLDVLEGLPFGTIQQVDMEAGESMVVPAQQAWPDLDPDQHHILGVIWSYANGKYSFVNAWQSPLEPGAISGTSDEHLLDGSLIFPNPAAAGDQIRITLPRSVDGKIHLALLDREGRRILDQSAQGPSLQMTLPASLAVGNYFLHVRAGQTHQAFPVQISR